MTKSNVKRDDKGSGADFINEKRAVDDAINERFKSESESDKLDPRTDNDSRKTEYDPNDSTKKSGRTKH
jgi:hypothetical protein